MARKVSDGDDKPLIYEDMVNMVVLDEASILGNLQDRFKGNNIYTFVGPILISINPYRPIPDVYSPSMFKKYNANNVENNSKSPHIYAIAANAFRRMMDYEMDQSILISGESGAGKTEACKHILNYLAEATGQGSAVQKQILQSNPLMEAFGNAKTVRNNNSSRFGKFIQIIFSRNGKIIGADITKYLLEKSRVVFQANHERNYHIFYELCAGVPKDMRATLQLGQAEQYKYLNQGNCTKITGVNDSAQFEITRKAMKTIGITDAGQLQIFKVLAAILHIGNIELEESKDKESVTILNEKEVGIAASLLGVKNTSLAFALCHRDITVGGQIFKKPLDLKQAIDSRDALAKGLYERIFDWLVKRINQSTSSKERWRTIGVLDIFGFEFFENNNFEQLCINYCNEKLQLMYNSHVFQQEQKEYRMENISCENVDFVDNQPCIDFFEKNLGILSILDEECRFPQATDKTFLDKLSSNHKQNPVFQKELRTNNKFLVRHFAGEVYYNVNGFLEKNRDSLRWELSHLMMNSDLVFVKDLFTDQKENDDVGSSGGSSGGSGIGVGIMGGRGRSDSINDSPRPASPGPDSTPEKRGSVDGRSSPAGASPSPLNRKSFLGPSGTAPSSVCAQFKTQLNNLMKMLSATYPHFVRCIKPNDHKMPDVFDDRLVMSQLRYTGVLGTIKIRQAGYPVRFAFPEFIQRYSILAPKITLLNPQEKAIALVKALDLDWAKWKVGLTKCFFKDPRTFDVLEKRRKARLAISAQKIQAVVKGRQERRKYLKLKQSTLILQLAGRKLLAKREAHVLKQQFLRKQEEERKRREKEQKEREEQMRREREQKLKEEREQKMREDKEREQRQREERELRAREDKAARELNHTHVHVHSHAHEGVKHDSHHNNNKATENFKFKYRVCECSKRKEKYHKENVDPNKTDVKALLQEIADKIGAESGHIYHNGETIVVEFFQYKYKYPLKPKTQPLVKPAAGLIMPHKSSVSVGKQSASPPPPPPNTITSSSTQQPSRPVVKKLPVSRLANAISDPQKPPPAASKTPTLKHLPRNNVLNKIQQFGSPGSSSPPSPTTSPTPTSPTGGVVGKLAPPGSRPRSNTTTSTQQQPLLPPQQHTLQPPTQKQLHRRSENIVLKSDSMDVDSILQQLDEELGGDDVIISPRKNTSKPTKNIPKLSIETMENSGNGNSTKKSPRSPKSPKSPHEKHLPPQPITTQTTTVQNRPGRRASGGAKAIPRPHHQVVDISKVSAALASSDNNDHHINNNNNHTNNNHHSNKHTHNNNNNNNNNNNTKPKQHVDVLAALPTRSKPAAVAHAPRHNALKRRSMEIDEKPMNFKERRLLLEGKMKVVLQSKLDTQFDDDDNPIIVHNIPKPEPPPAAAPTPQPLTVAPVLQSVTRDRPKAPGGRRPRAKGDKASTPTTTPTSTPTKPTHSHPAPTSTPTPTPTKQTYTTEPTTPTPTPTTSHNHHHHHQQQQAFGQLYGVDPFTFDCMIDNGYSVPGFLVLLKNTMIQHNGMEKEGIFRLTGTEKTITEISNNLSAGTFNSDLCTDVYSLASVIKRWYSKLPNKIFASLSFNVVQNALDQPTKAAQLVESAISPLSFELFQWLMDLSCEVVRNSDVNKMNAKNLAIMLAPVLMSDDIQDSSSYVQNLQKITTLLQHIIESLV